MPLPQDASQGQGGNAVDPRQIMQAIMARMAQQRGGMPAPPQNATPPGGMPQMPGGPQPGGMPGASGPPQQAQPQTQGGGAARQLSPAAPTPFNGTFGNRQGVISQLVNSAEKKHHDKKVNEASMYYNQINSFLASGNPEDQQRAQHLLDDPKVRKILKAGLDYVPLEEEVPPEAIGVQQAQQKIDQKQSALQQIKQMITGGQKQQPKPQGKAIIPQASQEAQQKFQQGEAKIEEEKAAAEEHRAKGEAETSKAETERMKMPPERAKAYAQADEASGHAKWYKQQVKESEDLTPTKKASLQAGKNLADARADMFGHIGKYYDRMPEGRLSGSLLRDDIKTSGAAMAEMLKGFIKDNQAAAAAVSKDTGWIFGPKSELLKKQEETKKLAEKMREGMAWFYGEGKQKVLEGDMSVPEAVAQSYKIAGITPPIPGDDSKEAPERPQGVPSEAEWDPDTRTWGIQ